MQGRVVVPDQLAGVQDVAGHGRADGEAGVVQVEDIEFVNLLDVDDDGRIPLPVLHGGQQIGAAAQD